MKRINLKRSFVFILVLCFVLSMASIALAQEIAEPAAELIEEMPAMEILKEEPVVSDVEEAVTVPELPTARTLADVPLTNNIPDIIEIKNLKEVRKYSPTEVEKMEGARLASISEVGEAGVARPMAQASLDSVNVGSISNTLTSSNAYDFLTFSFYDTRYFFFNFTSANSSYRATLCTVDTQGYIYTTSNVFAPGKNVVTLPANTSAKPMYCWLIQSTGSVGSSYTMSFNKTTNININPLYMTADQSVIYGNQGGTFYKNGSYMFAKSDSSLTWKRTMNNPQYQTVGGNTYGGYEKLEVEIYNPKAQKNIYGDMIAYGPYTYKGGGANTSFAWFIPLDIGTGYMTWYTNYMPGTGGWTVFSSADWIDKQTPIELNPQHLAKDQPYIVVDGNTGAVLDLYGVANSFYTYDKDAWPTFSLIK